MTQPKRPDRKPGYNPSNAYLQTPMCTKMIACDGVNLVSAARERGYCNKCGDAMAKKNKAPPPLKGENSALPVEMRRIDSKKKGEE
jgi:hypothetical protein